MAVLGITYFKSASRSSCDNIRINWHVCVLPDFSLENRAWCKYGLCHCIVFPLRFHFKMDPFSDNDVWFLSWVWRCRQIKNVLTMCRHSHFYLGRLSWWCIHVFSCRHAGTQYWTNMMAQCWQWNRTTHCLHLGIKVNLWIQFIEVFCIELFSSLVILTSLSFLV